MSKISVVLEDVEDKQKTTAVRTWLGKVKAEVNYADDLLDEFNTECLQLQLDKQSQAALKSSFKYGLINLKLSLKPSFIKKLMPKLRKVTATLEDFANQIKELGLRESDPTENYTYRAPSSSVVDKSQIFGRDDEKEKLIQMVLSDGGDLDVSVVAITGMGGIGKTTLAQLVYNDDRVKKKFQTRAWVCVSEDCDALKVTKALLMEVNFFVVDDKDDFNRLQVKLKENLAGKCFLIILDDIWNENSNDWSSLKTPLNGSRGSKIIVTMRNEKIARMVQNEPFHTLHPMSEDQSWCLFKSQAFDNGDHTPLDRFEVIGKEIVKKCKGLPLAIKTVAGALRPERDINVWHDFLSSEIWAAKGDIIPALSLSYKHLPPYLKCCFAFCALFPKDLLFGKDEVVFLWMANDLVKPSTLKVGRHCFEELKSRSFFESVDEKEYLMHDLINDLARSITKNTCIRLEDYHATDPHHSIQKVLPPELLHFSYLMNSYSVTSQKFKGLSQVRGLRTFLSIRDNRSTFSCSDMFPRLKCVRALSLTGYHIGMIPDSIGELKHLRYLNLQSTEIKNLPKSICKCLNLQILILANCFELVELPEEMRLLINLQHLDVRGVGDLFIETMATWLNIFKDIQNISVVVDKIQGSQVELLEKLQLRHSLTIIGLGDTDVATIERAKRAGLIGKDSIEELTLDWGSVAKCSEDDLNKLAILQPHTNTNKLCIKRYAGSRFPDWLGDSSFKNIQSLSLQDCRNCLALPPLGQLPGLKKLEIYGMDLISEIGKEFDGNASTSKPFAALQELKILNCKNILSFLELGLPSSLETLGIYNCSKMRICQTNWGLQTLPFLKVVCLHDFEDMLFPEEGLLPPSLEALYISRFSNLESLNEKGLQHLSSLQSLSIKKCPNLKYLPQEKFSSSLYTLLIHNCELVESFPEGLASSLSQLEIIDCPKLANCIEREKGEDWPKVSHIPEIYINKEIYG